MAEPPPEIVALGDARALARAGKEWAEADRLRGEIEAAGWKVVDRGLGYVLEPAFAPDREVDGRLRYGRSESVPSRLAEPARGLATAILVAEGEATATARAVEGLGSNAPAGVQIVVVADDPSQPLAHALEVLRGEGGPLRGADDELVLTATRLGPGGALDAGIRRAVAPVVLLLDPGVSIDGDVVAPLVAALDDPTVAVAGGWGSIATDLRRPRPAPAGDVDLIDEACLAFRRTDYVARGPLDQRFHARSRLTEWWTLILRDEGEGRPPRRAVVLPDLPLRRLPATEVADSEAAAARAAKRDFYRLFDRFGRRTDLLTGGGGGSSDGRGGATGASMGARP